jgi:U3 small nucleolar RNA-associated protein 19
MHVVSPRYQILHFPQVSTMPGTLDRSSSSKKRKRDHAIEPNDTVREEVGDVTHDASDDNAQSRIFQLESQITESRRYYNNIAALLSISRDDGRQNGEDLAAVVSLCRVFCRLIVSGNMSVTKGANDAEVTIVHWLKERYDDYLELLLAMLRGRSIRKVSCNGFEVTHLSLKVNSRVPL